MGKVFQTTVYIGSVDGKRIQKHIRANSEQELRKKKREIERLRDQGKDLFSVSTFDHWADRWYTELKEPSGIGPGTLGQYRAAISHLGEKFNGVDFKEIKFADFQRFINDYSNTPSAATRQLPSKASIQNVIKVYNSIATFAMESDIPGAKPFSKVTINKNAPVKTRRALTEQEIDWILETEHPGQLAAVIMIFSGLRRGELVPLRWSDIDLVNGYIDLTRFVTVDHSTFVMKPQGKSRAARRRIPIPSVLIDFIKLYRASTSINSMLVCPNKAGRMHSPSSFDNMIRSYVKVLNYKYGFSTPLNIKDTAGKRDLPMVIEPFTSHYFRHTFATLLYLQGVPATTAMQYLGHSDIQVTINIYTDLEQYYTFDLPKSFKDKLNTVYKVKVA